jgi:hypothetical protein
VDPGPDLGPGYGIQEIPNGTTKGKKTSNVMFSRADVLFFLLEASKLPKLESPFVEV